MATDKAEFERSGLELMAYTPGGYYDQMAQWQNQNAGTNFADGMDYLRAQFGPEVTIGPNGEVIPTGGNYDSLRPDLGYNPPDTFMDKFGLYAALGIAGGGLLAGAGGATGAAGGGDVALSNWFDPSMLTQFDTLGSGSTLGAAEGGGMGFFDDLLQLVAEGGAEAGWEQFFTPNIFQQSPDIFEGISTAGMTPGLENTLPFSLSGGATGTGAFAPALDFMGGPLANSAGGGNWWDSIVNAFTPGPGDLSKLLLGTNSGGGSRGIFDIFGDKGLLGTGLAAAPALSAINYAKNTSPFDTSGLTRISSEFDPDAAAFEYDTNTGLGRERLTSNLARRGIAGSSFGEADITNFNTTRDLGRRSLINQGLGTKVDIEKAIIDAQAKDRALKNQLYGSALLALSGSLTPRNVGLYAP